MRRIVILAISAALLAAACGNGMASDPTTAATGTATSSAPTTTPVVTTEPPATTTTTSTSPTRTTPEPPDPRVVEALAWGLHCRDLVAAGWDYAGAVAYWNVEGRPARMDADNNGIPCEAVYPTSDVTAYWGDPLPSGLSPGLGSGWNPSEREAPTTPACCSMNSNGPESPPLPPETGPFPYDGAYAVTVTRQEGNRSQLELEIRRWQPCSKSPEMCSPDLFPGDVYADPDHAVVRSIKLDDSLTVVIRPVAHIIDSTWSETPIEGEGAALGSLLRRVDAAVKTFIAPSYEAGTADESQFSATGAADPTFPYGPTPGEDLGWVLAYRGPEYTYLTNGFYTLLDTTQRVGMYGWWCTLEIIDGTPILYIWAGQIAG